MQELLLSPLQKARNAYIASELRLPPEMSSIVHVTAEGMVSFTTGTLPALRSLYKSVLDAGMRPSPALEQIVA